MADFDNTNRWTLNKNKDKADPKHSDYKGKINIDGKLFWIDGWIKQGQNGSFISGTVKAAQPKREDPISTGRLPAKQNILPDDDMDIPF
jgi:hypothetical protein